MKHLAVLLVISGCAAVAAVGAVESHAPAATKPAPADWKGSRPALAGTAEPYDFVSSGKTTVVPDPEFGAGPLKRWLFGDYYRDVWTTPLEVPIIDLDETAGGLIPLERGGGNQTISLRLRGGDGHIYDLRSVKKSAQRSMPERLRGTFVGTLAQDQNSSLNPLGALIVPPLARAAGVLHTHPTLVVIPDSPRLGPFRDEYAGMLAQFERKPDEDQSDAARFGFAKNVVGTEKLFEKLRENSEVRVDERAYARARLFDMLIGDRDRHAGQWRWSEFDTERGRRYVAVPTDRDFAFVKFDGFFNRIGRRSGKMTLRRLVDFDADIPDLLALNWQGFTLDRRLTPGLAREDWIELADSLRLALTDDVIDRAVRTWPEAVFELIGEMTARNLKSRRDSLPSVGGRYYDLLAETVEIAGSDVDERFEIIRLSAGETRVVLLTREGENLRELSGRTFRREETDEIWLDGIGGNDQIILYGNADEGLLVRIKGGQGTTAFIDSSAFDAPSRLRQEMR